ncbi:MAG: hypothetical protein AAGF15_05290 [Pseudomonadota bacterium]
MTTASHNRSNSDPDGHGSNKDRPDCETHPEPAETGATVAAEIIAIGKPKARDHQRYVEQIRVREALDLKPGEVDRFQGAALMIGMMEIEDEEN